MDISSVAAVFDWVRDPSGVEKPPRALLADAVRGTVRQLAQDAPGRTVEVRVPPFVAVQCIAGPAHTRGTPPNVFETDPLTWLQLATGELLLDAALADGRVQASGQRVTEVGRLLPVISL
ncbi:sterol carrier family protein [Corynebacterium marinum]|jgi:hypothetical protein|uniref:Bacterial SCP orthologue domain-containing protein n=2 Tax=Corynebacterium marinum TaxID=349751 RepID=A0A0B6TI97_9CORY|nr:sterol carrier family protein [Corynebacterium marinum]AJK69692.1 hypothetical protein B840_10595 [Corynebacterium marinum DSM 44953]NLF92041.1 hypothetical protein [Corynebacterium marinum]GGO18290.1 hypothetical protein GCM10010980_16330 [Corynebacterium marinum]